jgi:heme oxygenase
MATQIGPKIGIEGEKEYRQQIQQIIQQTKTLDAAMEKTASEWTKNTSQMTKNKAVAQNLVQQIDLQKQKLQQMNTMLDASVKKYGENATATLKWKAAVDSATASLNNMEHELSELKGANNFSELSTQMADVGQKMQNMGQTLTNIGTKMTASITLPLAAAGAASMKLASDLEESRNKVQVVFGSMAQSVEDFAANALESYGLAEGSALTMASTFGAMASSMGLSEQASASMSTSLTALAADMASFYNVSTEVAQTSLQGVFTGETEALKKFGIVMTQTNLEDFAKKMGKTYDQMSEGEKVLTRYAFVLDATKDAQGDFARTSDGAANTFRVFQESLKELGASLGEQILPIITPIVQAINSLIQKFAALPAPIRKIIVVIGLLVAAIGPVIMIIGLFMTSVGAIIAQAPIIAAAFASMIPAIKGLAASFIELTVAAAPWLLLAAAIAAAGYAVYKNWDDISAGAQKMANKVKEAFNDLKDRVESVRNTIANVIPDIEKFFEELPSKILNALKAGAQHIKEEFDRMIKTAKESGQHFIDGFVQGIMSRIEKIVNAVKEVANTVKQFLGFTRPDKGPLHEYEQWMPHFMQGLTKGIKSNIGLIKGAVDDVAKTMAIPLDATATMNMAYATAGADGSMPMFGGTSMNVYVDHISELNDLIRIQNQAQQKYRMGAR